MNKRKVFAVIEVDDDMAIAEDKGTGDYLEEEFGWLEQSGISLRDWLLSDEDDVEKWARYIDYLIEWAFDHSDTTAYNNKSPACYDEWDDNEDDKLAKRMRIETALQCLRDNGIDKQECPEVLKALCYILCDDEIEDLLEESDYSD